jgi:N-succinyldiaminopimelate aminotransferase
MAERPALSSKLAPFGTTIFTEMTRLANEHGAINLAQGFPDFEGPAFVGEAAQRAIAEGHNQYARMAGAPVLVEAIATDLAARTGIDYDPLSEVVVTSGATEAIHATIMALCEPGDEVVMLEPYYDSYRACCAMAGAVPRYVTLNAPGFKWCGKQLPDAFNERTRILLLNTPHNPTGRVLTRAETETLAALCRKHDVICVTDEVYDRLVFEGEHVPMATLPGMRERTVTINSTGKTFSMTGWKIGWVTAPAELAKAVATAHQFVTFAVAHPFQHAMAAALREAGERGYFETFLSDYRKRRDYLCDVLTECGLALRPSEGTYFVMADVRPLGWDDDVAFCRHVTEHVGVAAIPPTSFYENQDAGRFLVRFAFCKRMETLERAAERLRARLRPRGEGR